MILTVDPQTPQDHGTIVVFTGYDPVGDRTVTFGVDHRPAQSLIEALEFGGTLDAEVEDYQILGSSV